MRERNSARGRRCFSELPLTALKRDAATVRWAAAFLVVLVACSSNLGSGRTQGTQQGWNAPPARWVSDLSRFEERYTYNETSAVSDRGRWVVFTSHVKDRPSRLFLVDVDRGRVRRIDKTFNGDPRRSEGIGRYNIARGILHPDITPDGRFVVFTSGFSNLVPGDKNRAVDIFLYDRVSRQMKIVSRSSGGAQTDGDSYNPALSPNGRFVVFDSRASNLVTDDRDRRSDVFLRDLRSGRTEIVSIGAGGEANAPSSQADVSADGKRISFFSAASNLVEGDTNDLGDVFLRDTGTAETLRVSVTSDGKQYESFESEESASVYHASVGNPQISADGETIVFQGNANRLVEDDINYNDDIFIHEVSTGVTERVSVRSDGADAYGDDSVECGKDPVCAGFSPTHTASISADGTLVYFISAAPLISDKDDDDEARGTDEQVFVRDLVKDVTLLASRYRDGSPVQSSNWYPGEISADGRWVTYSNNSMKLDGPKGDEDPGPDVFLQRLP